jgi:hypothetical protein
VLSIQFMRCDQPEGPPDTCLGTSEGREVMPRQGEDCWCAWSIAPEEEKNALSGGERSVYASRAHQLARRLHMFAVDDVGSRCAVGVVSHERMPGGGQLHFCRSDPRLAARVE